MDNDIKKDILQWDVKSWSKPLLYWDKKINWNNVHNCLELGGNAGGLSLWLALKGKNTVCSDLEDVKKNAETLHKHYNVNPLIQYQDIDATNIPYDNYFDIIVFKSIIGGIGRNDNIEIQQTVFDEIYKALKPGGKLLFAENLVGSQLHKQLRKRFVNWGNSWRYISKKEMNQFLHRFSSYELKTTGILGAFGRSENQRKFLASIDDIFLNKICPDNWKYIVYGIAKK